MPKTTTLGLDVSILLNPGVPAVYLAVARERFRAATLHGSSSIELAPADDPRWWTVCMEEVGEVARAFQESPERLYEELVQTAAMFTAWAEAARESC